MSNISYFKFIGARHTRRRLIARLILIFRLLYLFKQHLDCDEKAFKDGVRPGDTIRQAKLASPLCRVVPVYDATSKELKNILDVLATITPFVEPDDQGCEFLQRFLMTNPCPRLLPY
jgi:hypothetical protein